MTLDEHALLEAEQARDRMEAAQDAVERARGDYHRAVRRLHASGGTLREIADALGLSHQRVHQVVESGSMIEPDSEEPRRGHLLHCTFCDTSQKQTKKLIAGPGIYICEVCVATADAVGAGKTPKKPRARLVPRPETAKAKCSFCGKKRPKVEWMLEGALVDERICNECTQLCVDIIADEWPNRPGDPSKGR